MTQVLGEATTVLDRRDLLGESPIWDAANERLVWCDIHGRRINELRRDGDGWAAGASWETDDLPGAVVPHRDGGLLAMVGDRFCRLGDDGTLEPFARVDLGGVPTRFNDCRVDPRGRLLAGTMVLDLSRPGELMRLDPDGSVTPVLGDIALSNGLDWSPDGETFFWIDSLNGQSVLDANDNGVDAFDYDTTTGAVSNRRRAVSIPNERTGPAWQTIPDGMTLDTDGFVWVAIAGGSEVRRYSPSGDLETVVEMPVSCPTSVGFGGDDLRDLYITTMTLETAVPSEYRRHEAFAQDRPLEGALFRCHTRVAGRPVRQFAG